MIEERVQAESVVVSTWRILAALILASSLIALEVFKAYPTGRLGVSLVALILALRVYSAIATVSLARCRVTARVEGSGVEGKPIKLVYSICNESITPIALAELSLQYPDYLKISRGSPGALAILPPRGCLDYEVEFKSRVGRHTLGPLRVVYRDLFGFFRSQELKLGEQLEVRVIPRVDEKIRRAAFSASRSAGLARARLAGEGVEFYSVREYEPGDELRRVYWRALARGRLAVKEYERETLLYVLFVIVADNSMIHGPYLSTPLEHSLRILGSVASYLASRGDYLALAISTPRRNTVVGFKRGRAGLAAILNAVASIDIQDMRVQEDRGVVSHRLSSLERDIVVALPRDRVNVIVVSTASMAEAVAETLGKLGLIEGVSLNFFILLPHLYGVEELSDFERAVYRVRTYQATRDAHLVARRLRGRGFRAVVVTPWDMASKILARLEAQRGVLGVWAKA